MKLGIFDPHIQTQFLEQFIPYVNADKLLKNGECEWKGVQKRCFCTPKPPFLPSFFFQNIQYMQIDASVRFHNLTGIFSASEK